MNLKLLLFLISIHTLFTGCRQNNHAKDTSEKVIKIGINSEPQTLDPRVARSLEAVTPLHMIYEGLMRADVNGRPIPGLAEHYTLSEDMKTYTFHLRKSVWSNGEPLTSQDFIETWKDILSPNFQSPNAYQFYLIKGAKAAKEGKIFFEETGIKAPDAHTLIIELDDPTPYFLELLCTHFFYPVYRQFSASNAISNGPFTLQDWQKHRELIFVKNPKYWDSTEVVLQKIILLPLDEQTALRMFENGELEWAGSPLGTIPQDAVKTLRHRHQLRILSAAGTHWFRVNTEASPFNSIKMRQAFAYALDRKSIVEHVTLGNQKPATAIIPPFLGLPANSFFKDHDVPKAWYAFQESLEELKISKDELPVITLCYGNSDRNHKVAQAVQQQWQKALGIEVKLENCEAQVLYERISRHNYQIAMGAWFADFRDPISFLEVFKYKQDSTNNTQWENKDYIEQLNLSSLETDAFKRLETLYKAEAILMQNMPVIPLFYGAFNYVKAENLFGVFFSELGYLDFKYAYYGE